MANVSCSASASANSCSHFQVTIGGVTYEWHAGDLTALSAEELELFRKLAVRYSGLNLSTLANKVIHGSDATNVKIYQLFGPGAVITKTNIGTSYVNILAGANGEPTPLDFTGCTEFRIILHANLVGSGAFRAKLVNSADAAILYENTNLGAAGERELDTGWQALPAAFVNAGLLFVKGQANSATAADDPAFRSLRVGLR
jgi:hypothetical protein